MRLYQCASCGKRFDPEKNEICPRCGAAVAPSVLTRMERKQTAQRLRADGKLNNDDHCHEDDSWTDSYGASTHLAAVKSHEATLRAGYASHQAADNPTRLSNANPARATNVAAVPKSGENPTRLSNANPAARPAARSTGSHKKTGGGHLIWWLVVAWFVYVLVRVIIGIINQSNDFRDVFEQFEFFW